MKVMAGEMDGRTKQTTKGEEEEAWPLSTWGKLAFPHEAGAVWYPDESNSTWINMKGGTKEKEALQIKKKNTCSMCLPFSR